MTNPSDNLKTSGPSEIFPVLPLRDIVVFPYMIVPLFVGREKSINALDEVMRTDRKSCSRRKRTPATTIRSRAASTR